MELELYKKDTMTNREKFNNIFNVYALELWSMDEERFWKWCNEEYEDESFEVLKGKITYTNDDNEEVNMPIWICTHCLHGIYSSNVEYCPYCGSKLIWK